MVWPPASADLLAIHLFHLPRPAEHSAAEPGVGEHGGVSLLSREQGEEWI